MKASYGHVMDLPKKTIGILLPAGPDGSVKPRAKRKTKKGKAGAEAKSEPKKLIKTIAATPEEEFEPTYEVIPGKMKVIGELRKAAESAENVYLATDPDREGEAISAHLLEALAKKKSDRGKFYRVMFNEITQKAIRAAFEKPGAIDEHLVDAQQARRVLDRLVGYKVSPVLWDKVRRGLSAGRVQTVALRLIVEREREIRAFIPKEYWTIHALLEAGGPPAFEAKLAKHKGEDIEIPNEAEAQRILADLERAKWQVASVAQKEKRRFAPPPFTTSKLQQAGYNRLRYTAKRTMMLAQRLYEGVELGEEGSVALITYMRTDSVRVSNDALGAGPRTHRLELTAKSICRRSRTSSSRRRTRRKRTKPFVPPTWRARRKAFAAVSAGRHVPAVPDDLAALRRLADGSGRFRPDHRGHFRERLHLPRQRIGGEVRRLSGRLPGGEGRRGKGRRGRYRQPHAAAIDAKAKSCASKPSAPTSTLPSRRRATPKRRW